MAGHIPFVDFDLADTNRVTAEWLNDLNNLRYGNGLTTRGAALLNYTSTAAGAVEGTQAQRNETELSVFDFMTAGEIAAVLSGTYTAGLITSVTAALQAAHLAVSTRTQNYDSGIHSPSAPSLFYPKGYYKIEDSIQLPVYAPRIYGDFAIIEQTSITDPIFLSVGINNVTLEGFVFVGANVTAIGDNGGAVVNADTTLLVKNCVFQTASTSRYAISLTQNALTVELDNPNVFNAPLWLALDTDEAVIRGGIVYGDLRATGQKPVNSRSILNNCGRMSIYDTRFVPQTDAVTVQANTRWVDNYGDFFSYNVRWGGEVAGFPIVYQFANGPTAASASPYMSGTVVISGGYAYCGASSRVDKGMVVLQDNIVPGTITIIGTTGNNNAAFISAWGYDPDPPTASVQLQARILTQQSNNFAVRIAITLLGNNQYASSLYPSCLRPYTLSLDSANTSDHASVIFPGLISITNTLNTTAFAVAGYINGSRHQPFIEGEKRGITTATAFDAIIFTKDANTNAGAVAGMTGILTVNFTDLETGPVYVSCSKQFLVNLVAPGTGTITFAQKDKDFLTQGGLGDIITLALKAGTSATSAIIQIIVTHANIIPAVASCSWRFEMLSTTGIPTAGAALNFQATSA